VGNERQDKANISAALAETEEQTRLLGEIAIGWRSQGSGEAQVERPQKLGVLR
jgi:hypothetical protein